MDGVVLFVVVALLRLAAGYPLLGGRHPSTEDAAVSLALAVLAGLVYLPLMMWRTDGQTLGKRLFGLRVVRANGEPVRFGVAVIREIVGKVGAFGLAVAAIFVPSLGGLLGIDYLWALWDPYNRTLHDLLARTLVVRIAKR